MEGMLWGQQHLLHQLLQKLLQMDPGAGALIPELLQKLYKLSTLQVVKFALQGFEKAMNALGPPAAPAPDLPDRLPPIDPKSKGTADHETDVPSLSDLGYLETACTPFKVPLGTPSLPPSLHHANAWPVLSRWLHMLMDCS